MQASGVQAKCCHWLGRLWPVCNENSHFRELSFVPLRVCTRGCGSLNHGIWPFRRAFGTQKPRVTNIKGTNSKSLIIMVVTIVVFIVILVAMTSLRASWLPYLLLLRFSIQEEGL